MKARKPELIDKGEGSIPNGIWRKGVLGILGHPEKIYRKALHSFARSSLASPRLRCRLHRLRRVDFADVNAVFIGSNVLLDEMYPELISIGRNVIIAEGAKILTHYYDTSFKEHSFYNGRVCIEDDVFIGVGAVVAAPVHIGRGAVIGANSVITMDVSRNTIVGGNPARELGLRGATEPINLSAVHKQ